MCGWWVWYGVVWCGVVWCGVVWCGVVYGVWCMVYGVWCMVYGVVYGVVCNQTTQYSGAHSNERKAAHFFESFLARTLNNSRSPHMPLHC
jgi:hypothetical protein